MVMHNAHTCSQIGVSKVKLAKLESFGMYFYIHFQSSLIFFNLISTQRQMGVQKSRNHCKFYCFICHMYLVKSKIVQGGVLELVPFVIIGRYFLYGIRAWRHRSHPGRTKQSLTGWNIDIYLAGLCEQRHDLILYVPYIVPFHLAYSRTVLENTVVKSK